MTNTSPLGVAVVGYGWWGKTICATLRESQTMTVRRVVEPDATTRAAAQAAGFAADATLDAALADPTVEAVVLCSPHREHAAQILACAAAGRHVFCEKPLCPTLAEARAAVQACQSRGLVLGIGHERRFEPAIVALRERIAAGELGEVLQIEANFSQDKFLALPPDNWRLSPTLAPVGPLTATGIHLVDLSIALLGPADTVWARLSSRGAGFANGDTLAVTLGFPNGATALISAILATPFDGRFAVYGSRGWIEVRDRTHPEHPTGWDVTVKLRGAEPARAFVPPHASVRANLEAFAAAARGGPAYPVRPEEMLANVAALEAIMRSAASRAIEPVATP